LSRILCEGDSRRALITLNQPDVMNTPRLATIPGGITRHAPEGLNFEARAEEMGWKQAVAKRGCGPGG
tara:strand:- start:616 stop:819 length:204 start_codon:yes stop_codon:yes gene_type:complete